MKDNIGEQKMKTETGLIVFFDILGYQNLLERNEPEQIAEPVLLFLSNMGQIVQDYMKDSCPVEIQGKYRGDFHKVIDSIRVLIFSDTILLTMPFEEDKELEKEEELFKNGVKWIIFFSACINLQLRMFKRGLPVRGVINFGKFCIHETCFVGKPIVEAYQICNRLDFAACVLAQSAQQELNQIDPEIKKQMSWSFYEKLVYEYLVPKKDGESHEFVLAAPTYNKNDDIRTQVLAAFRGHNKDIPTSVRSKLFNTEQWLQYLRMKRGEEIQRNAPAKKEG